MERVIAQLTLKLIKKLLWVTLILAISTSGLGQSRHFKRLTSLPTKVLRLADGSKMTVYVASQEREQALGLSGVRESEFDPSHGLFFDYQQSKERRFWMPYTHFDLDIIFLDEKLKVTNIIRQMPKHPNHKGNVPTTKAYHCRYALEVKAKSPVSKLINLGDQLSWSPQNSSETESKTH